MAETIRYCPDCGRDRLFEQHHAAGYCPDDPDGCCSEWSCTDCGSALLIQAGLEITDRRAERGGRVHLGSLG